MTKLRPIPANTVVHTPTEEEAKELLAILHENGWKWIDNKLLTSRMRWDDHENQTCYHLHHNVVRFSGKEWFEATSMTILSLSEFKERYCEVTEKSTEKAEETSVIQQKPQPKFKVGDRIKVVGCQETCISMMKPHVSKVGTITRASESENYYNITCDNGFFWWREDWLESYTEPETKPTENVETKDEAKDEAKEAKGDTKELNLCELLKGHEGETFYSLVIGECTLTEITTSDTYPIKLSHSHYSADGKFELSGEPVIFPSRALYEQYPLDPYTAWMKWKEEQRTYEINISIDYCENFMGAVDATTLTFRTPADRDKCIAEIKTIIEKYSK